MDTGDSRTPLRWPALPEGPDAASECVLLLETNGGRPLTLVSNSPYELWLDGRFVGDGGHRCVPGEALADAWPEAAAAAHVRVRLHWLDPTQSPVLYRCLFDDPFFAELSSSAAWRAHADVSVRFAAKASAQLPRQNVLVGPPTGGRELPWQPVPSTSAWRILPSPIESARYVPVEPRWLGAIELEAATCLPFRPIEAGDVAEYIRGGRPCRLRCETFDLGSIALHRFEIDAGSTPCVLQYAEVADFDQVTLPRYRAKVHLADAVAADVQGAAPFGTRGCRYVQVVYPCEAARRPVLRSFRREYPLRWKAIATAPEDVEILAACRANLVACVDGGVVDTCWRERAQWTGDLRMSAAALRALTENTEVIDLALHQIARSYDPRTGMVAGAWPILRPGAALPIPPFHLAFCLAALEHDPSLQRDEQVRRVVHDSFELWTRRHLRDGLIRGMDGWYFTDWDPTDPAAAGRQPGAFGAHAICNAWWNVWCDVLDPARAVTAEAFDAEFWNGRAYVLARGQSHDSPHATAAALDSSAGRLHVAEGLRYLEAELDAGRLRQRVTPYFGYFVARALRRDSDARMIAFIREFYGPIACSHGTIYEKTTPDASLAHGWSIGISELLVGAARGTHDSAPT